MRKKIGKAWTLGVVHTASVLCDFGPSLFWLHCLFLVINLQVLLTFIFLGLLMLLWVNLLHVLVFCLATFYCNCNFFSILVFL